MMCKSIVAAVAALALAASVEASEFSDFAKSMAQQPAAQSALSDSDIATGLKQALAKGTKTAIDALGKTDGFWADARFRIPLPGPVAQIESFLKGSGKGDEIEAFHLAINRAAENAVPVAADVFSEAVQKLSLDDVRGILNGPQDAATQYFKRATSDTLAVKFKPIVAGVTAKTGLVQQYNGLLASAGPMAGMLGKKGDVNDYVTSKALDGLFLRVGDEEKSIRTDPAARSTELMKKVFGSR
jgi:hypothetical protein